jgi:hypothetical protein
VTSCIRVMLAQRSLAMVQRSPGACIRHACAARFAAAQRFKQRPCWSNGTGSAGQMEPVKCWSSTCAARFAAAQRFKKRPWWSNGTGSAGQMEPVKYWSSTCAARFAARTAGGLLQSVPAIRALSDRFSRQVKGKQSSAGQKPVKQRPCDQGPHRRLALECAQGALGSRARNLSPGQPELGSRARVLSPGQPELGSRALRLGPTGRALRPRARCTRFRFSGTGQVLVKWNWSSAGQMELEVLVKWNRSSAGQVLYLVPDQYLTTICAAGGCSYLTSILTSI